MAWATTIGPDMRQIDYRLQENSGCGLAAEHDGQVGYRLDSDRPLEWIGEGLREVGITPGDALDDEGKTAARMLADGRDPRTGERLVEAKKAVDPRAKVDAGPLVDAVRQAAEAAGTTPAQLLGEPRAVARFGRLQRGVARETNRAEARARARLKDAAAVAHRAPVADLEKVAKAAGIRLDDVYDTGVLAAAREYTNARVVVGNRGYDLTLDLPKSYSVLVAMADPKTARELEDAYLDCVRETVTAVQSWAGYAMRGHHGDGQRAERVEGTGLLGWMTVHRTARPVAGAAPDPHLHAHVTFANMVRSADKVGDDTERQWNTIGAGGRDIHRHVKAAGTLVQARLRQVTTERWGVEWARDPGTGAWEITGVPASLREVFSKRQAQIDTALEGRGLDREKATTEQVKLAAQQSKRDKNPSGTDTDLRGDWHAQAAAAGADPARLVAAAMPGPRPPAERGEVGVDDLAAWVFRDETGLTAHRKTATRADVLAEVLDADAAGVASLAAAEQLADAVLAGDTAVALPAVGAVHLSNAQRYTSTQIVDAERTVIAAARDRFAGGHAVAGETATALAVAQFEAAAGVTLSGEQRAVLDRLTGAGHGVDTVVGVAGAGKTTIMAVLRAAYEAEGKTVAGAATAAVAAANLTSGAGIEADTVASWLQGITEGRGRRSQGLTGVDVLVVDEAAMVDDRHLARLLTAAADSDTKVVAIGDPKQLKAVGVGGTFAAVHSMLGGLELTENRRQRDHTEREALAVWRADERRTALQQWADSGRVHVTTTADQAHEAMLARWAQARGGFGDGHDAIERLLMLAHTNADVDALNHAAQQHREQAGELGYGARYRLSAGGHVTLRAGDQVMTRTNNAELGVLNGQRGIVVDVDEPTGRVTIERHQLGTDGPELIRTQLPRRYVHDGGVQLAYAITAAKAQGLTADTTLVYGNGMDAHVLYPAMSRDRHRADLWLALDPLETDADRARHGPPGTDAQARQRAVDAYATAVSNDRPDGIVLAELGETPEPITSRPASEPRPEPAPQPAPGPGPVTDVDALAARIAAHDAQLRQPSERDLLRERLQQARLDAAGKKAVAEQTRREVRAELHAIAAGDQPSGRFTREQLHEHLAVVRAEQARRQRETAVAAGGRAEHVPAGATTGHLPWQQRLYGKLTDIQLAAAIREADHVVSTNRQQAQQLLRQTEQQTAQARAGHGPAMTALAEHRDRLSTAAAAPGDAARAHRDAGDARQRATEARQQAQRLTEQRRRSPLRLRLSGTNRAAIDAQLTALYAQIQQHDQEGWQARGRAENADRLARATPQAADRLTELHRDWPARAAAATTADLDAADRSHSADLHRQHADTWQHRGDGLRAEAALRQQLDPASVRAEDTARQAHQHHQMRERARQATAEAARRPPPPRPDLHRGGPSLGR